MLKFEVNREGGGDNFTLCHQLRSQNTSAGIELN